MKATIHPIEPFDASLGTTIRFTWNGNQIHKVRCSICENELGTSVFNEDYIYNETIDIMKQEFIIPPNSGLKNGINYICYITVIDAENSESDRSDPSQFYCFTTPVFQLSIKNNDVIRSSSYEVGLSYAQAENEELQSYSIYLYSYQKTLIQSSGTVYDTQSSYLISSLENANQYYIRAAGITKHGMHLETRDILFTVAYENLQSFSTLELNNMPDLGAVELRSNLISTEGQSDNPVIFIDNKYADLRDNSVVFQTGYQIEGDFSHVFKLFDCKINQKILTLSDGNKTQIDCFYREGTFDNSSGKKAVIELTAASSDVNYVIYSNYFEIPTDEQCICFCTTRTGNFFDIAALLLPKTTERK
ncbi:hypothetical protein C0033_07455 [Clostridium sp. chh4-2]|uniref:hypothetical protein n=1 Tax=Clostridium sp. chh4-2 TaxID=2067550 RepID=UPI000CCE0C32|nr:hypothetical protein [Clostridium sp. chh4-2]PNV62845.1 hypothetical protein C0033_07455 [Clostridium sp. chh4-2]